VEASITTDYYRYNSDDTGDEEGVATSMANEMDL
jgi:hypothetical protein